MKTITSVLAGMLIGAAAVVGAQQTVKGGYIVERDADVAKKEPGTHNGGFRSCALPSTASAILTSEIAPADRPRRVQQHDNHEIVV
jgi:3-methyladenine DNA glycosylase Mpg